MGMPPHETIQLKETLQLSRGMFCVAEKENQLNTFSQNSPGQRTSLEKMFEDSDLIRNQLVDFHD